MLRAVQLRDDLLRRSPTIDTIRKKIRIKNLGLMSL